MGAPQAPEAHAIRFVLDGRVHRIDGATARVPPTTSVLSYVREHLRRTGTKEGCAEGDCGACTVVVASLDGDCGEIRTRTVNACLQLLPFLDGKALFTVESLRADDGSLHPVQQAMVDCHGSQCGFCTPGFVMSLFDLYVGATRVSSQPVCPSDRETRTALAGNLCRCTGYRPILDASRAMFGHPIVALDRAAIREQLESIRRTDPLDYTGNGIRYSAPRTLAQLHALRAQHPDATVVAGNTDVGLWINKQLREIGHLVAVGEVAELQAIRATDMSIRIGAAVPLEDAYRALALHYPQLTEMWERFASPPIRNAGTLGGNVANGSPIGDSMPGLIALQSKVVLSSVRGARTIALEDLYLGYQQKAMEEDEIVEAVEVPLPSPALRFRTYKVSKRYDSDISAVCAAFALTLDGDTVGGCRIAFGGMAATPKRALNAEAALLGRRWDAAAVEAAAAALAIDFQPLSDLRASDVYRNRVARGLLERFHLETRSERPLDTAALSVFAT